MEGYRAVFEYLNRALPADVQYEIEDETDTDYAIIPLQLRRQLNYILTSVHDDVGRRKFREAIKEMGLEIPYQDGLTAEDSETEWRTHLADRLASHYMTEVMVRRAVERGGR